MKFFTVLAAAAAVFSGFVAASPVAIASPNALAAAAPAPVADVALVKRTQQEETEGAIIDLVVKLDIDIGLICDKYVEKCKGKPCGTKEIKEFQLEIIAVIKVCIELIKVKIFAGFKFVDGSVIIKLLAGILYKINITLQILCAGLGLVGALLTQLLLLLLADLKIVLLSLLALLATVVDGLITEVSKLLAGLLGGAVCLICGLLGLVL